MPEGHAQGSPAPKGKGGGRRREKKREKEEGVGLCCLFYDNKYSNVGLSSSSVESALDERSEATESNDSGILLQ